MPDTIIPSAESSLKLNPAKVNKFIQDELDGTAPPEVVDFVNRMRKEKPGMFPPPTFPETGVGRVNNTGKIQPRPTELPAAPVPQMGIKDRFLAGIPDAIEWAKNTGKAMLDPEALAATGAGVYTAARGTGIGALASGAAASGVAAIHEGYDAIHEGRAPRAAPVAEAFLTGGLSELGARAVSGVTRVPVTPQGVKAGKFFGENVMAHQLTDSPALNFAANVAKYGPTGQHIFNEAEQKQSQHVLDYLQGISHEYGPNISIDPATGEFDRGMAGKQAQRDIRTQVKGARANSGYPEFSEKYGGVQEPAKVGKRGTDLGSQLDEAAEGPVVLAPGKTVDELQARRSAALKRSRQAYSAGDVSAQSQFLKQAEKTEGRIVKALPDDVAREEYRAIADKYKAEMGRLDNPTVSAVRTGKSESLVDNILNNNLKNYAPMETGVGQTNKELLGRLQSALSPQSWAQLQADTVHRLGERSIDPKTGLVDVAIMKKMIDGLDGGTKQKLFGKGLDKLNETLGAMTQAQNYKKQEAGRLFIAIRYGQAVIASGAGVIGAASGNPKAGTLAAAAVIISPYAFAKMLTSPLGRSLLTKAATTSGAGTQVRKAITRWVAQNVTEEGREVMNEKHSTETPVEDNYIPEPPR